MLAGDAMTDTSARARADIILGTVRFNQGERRQGVALLRRALAHLYKASFPSDFSAVLTPVLSHLTEEELSWSYLAS